MMVATWHPDANGPADKTTLSSTIALIDGQKWRKKSHFYLINIAATSLEGAYWLKVLIWLLSSRVGTDLSAFRHKKSENVEAIVAAKTALLDCRSEGSATNRSTEAHDGVAANFWSRGTSGGA